ncbi:hypothetical protein [Nostoc sp.]|uniref:hypothetical protein n=1 Tax=Nostoc sp. TaxID=1180 RepID=UPI002FFD4604
MYLSSVNSSFNSIKYVENTSIDHKNDAFIDEIVAFVNETVAFVDETVAFVNETVAFVDETVAFVDENVAPRDAMIRHQTQ